jgi:hypothetical protein
LIDTVKSFGASLSAGLYTGLPTGMPNRVVTFTLGLCAMFSAAVAVCVGVIPIEPLDFAWLNRLVHAEEPGPVEFTQAVRMFASVLIVAAGTAPLPAGVVLSALPMAFDARLDAFVNAFASPSSASLVPELDTCVSSVANPAIA